MSNRTWEQEIQGLNVLFEEIVSKQLNDTGYLFSSLVKGENNQFLACDVFEDEIVINQIGYHIHEGDDVSPMLNLLATLLSAVEATRPTYIAAKAEEDEIRVQARNDFGAKY